MIHIITISYNNADVLENSIERYYELCYYKNVHHVIADMDYPLHRDKTKQKIFDISKKYGLEIVEGNKNLGMFALTNLIAQCNCQPDDYIIVYDSNCYPITEHFDKMLIDSLKFENTSISCATQENELDYTLKDNIKYSTVNEVNKKYKKIVQNSIGAIQYKNHLMIPYEANQKKFSKKYSDLVFSLNENSNKVGMEMNYVLNCNENFYFLQNFEDNKYLKYKNYIKGVLNEISFEEFLENDIYEKHAYNVSHGISEKIKLFSGL